MMMIIMIIIASINIIYTCYFCACGARRGTTQSLAKSSLYEGPSAGTFTEVARLVKQKKPKLGILGGAKVSGSFGFNHLRSSPLKPFSQS